MNVTEVARFTKNNFLSFVRKLKKGVVYSFFYRFLFLSFSGVKQSLFSIF
ncbi:hypothetical protein HMPREF9088_1745 [Enterococcus italicus DSM 15952]|uniref:Uncharacterized protein n=1 Tax=Enterococcus italicus (strain DSM 15952 / CCUG 50447 / LMG 22039 / TP 1.5) TaxID=888064 RepID=E6LHA5_ENTI1|nr:hypothetical protein HMPREF9088_1745 [Enterococcus italicus DSM 15952]OJG58402.1 hypothetical protein RT43_GL000710 [Enterococcus italicus DSM 15952]